MKKSWPTILLVLIGVLGFALYGFFRAQNGAPLRTHLYDRSNSVSNKIIPNVTNLADTYPQIDSQSLSEQQIGEEVRRREREDKRWEWKIPIRFYGKVVDQDSRPIAHVQIHFQWNDLSPHGTSERTVDSDAQGLFSLNNARGKGLSVRVSKDGYYTSISDNQMNYEFANPYEKIFYTPNAAAPVIFHLRKKWPGENLVTKSIGVSIAFGEHVSTRIDLLQGRESSDGQLVLDVSKPIAQKKPSFPYDWKVAISIPNGGLIEHSDEFPFQAPETGYQSKLEYSLHAENGMKGVALEKQFYFVIDQSKLYGRLSIQTDGHRHYVSIDYALNPSGSRNLEPASGKGTN